MRLGKHKFGKGGRLVRIGRFTFQFDFSADGWHFESGSFTHCPIFLLSRTKGKFSGGYDLILLWVRLAVVKSEVCINNLL
jgi:hypothetical protein